MYIDLRERDHYHYSNNTAMKTKSRGVKLNTIDWLHGFTYGDWDSKMAAITMVKVNNAIATLYLNLYTRASISDNI
jgi:hypothetical protein